MSLLTNPLVLRAALLLFGATVAFGLALFLMRQLRKTLVSESACREAAQADRTNGCFPRRYGDGKKCS